MTKQKSCLKAVHPDIANQTIALIGGVVIRPWLERRGTANALQQPCAWRTVSSRMARKLENEVDS